MGEVTLREITRENWQDAFRLSVEPEQLEFIAEGTPPAAIALAKAYIRPNGFPAIPYGIYSDETMVGFFNLVYEPGSLDNYWVFHYFIDRSYQRRGLGVAGLHSLIGLLQSAFPGCRSLALTVHPENERARKLYTSFGFEPTGEAAFGEPVFRISVRPEPG